MADPRAWDIWVVPFPYTDRLAEKRRPALVISSDALLREAGLIWVAMITSTKLNHWSGDVEVADLDSAGLRIACRVRTAKVATIETDRLIRRLGRLSAADLRSVHDRVKRYRATP